MTASRWPMGWSPSSVVSRAVWCSISELIWAPSSTTKAVMNSHMSRITTAASEP